MLKNLRYKTKVKIKNRKGALVMNIERKILVKLKIYIHLIKIKTITLWLP